MPFGHFLSKRKEGRKKEIKNKKIKQLSHRIFEISPSAAVCDKHMEAPAAALISILLAFVFIVSSSH